MAFERSLEGWKSFSRMADHGGLARDTTVSRPGFRKGRGARRWMRARKGRPLKMTGAQAERGGAGGGRAEVSPRATVKT